MYVRPDAGRRQRAFLLLDESAQLNQPVVFQPALAATQAFVDRHLQGKNHDGPDWPDFPPAALAPVREIEIPDR